MSTIDQAQFAAAVVALVAALRHAFPKLDGKIAILLSAVVLGAVGSLARRYVPADIMGGVLAALSAVGGMTAIDRVGSWLPEGSK